VAQSARSRRGDESGHLYRGPWLHRNRTGLPRGNRRVSPRAAGGHRGGQAPARRRRPGRPGDQAGQLRRVRILDALVLTGPHRDTKGVRRTGWQAEMTLPTFADIESAATEVEGVAHRTLVASSRTLDAETGASLFFKCENLQRAGAFKFRGAYNAL